MITHIKKYLPPIIAGVVVIIFGLIISNYLGHYDLIPELDSIYHVLGGVVLGWFFYRYFTNHASGLTAFNLTLVCVASVCLIGVFWEIAERLSSIYSDPYFPWLYRWFHGGDLDDTLFDLLCDMFGGFAFVVASIVTRRKV